MKEKYNLFNNDKAIGKVVSHTTNIKKFMLLAGLGYMLLTTVGCGREENAIEETIEETQEDVYVNTYEQTFNVDYTVKFGDTLTGIIYSYESDANKVYRYIDDIVRLNDLDSQNSLRDGMTITLVGVPESKLADFGYSADYSLFNPELELMDRVKYINNYSTSIYETEENRDAVMEFRLREANIDNLLHDYYMSEESEEKEKLLDVLLEEYRSLCDELRNLVGVSFDNHQNAYPLDASLEKNDGMNLK